MKKVVLVTYEDIYSLPLVEAFLNNRNYKVFKILRSGTIYGNKRGLDGILFLLRQSSLLFIAPKFFENILFILYKSFLHKSKRPFKTLVELSNEYDVPVEVVYDINDYPHHQHKGAVLFSLYFNQLFSKDMRGLYGEAYNIHPAPLPVGRGLFAQFWLLLNPYETKRYYQTIHRITSKIDGGEIIGQESVERGQADFSMADYMNKVTVLGIDMMRNFNSHPQENVHVPITQSYYSLPKAKDVWTFWRRGLHFITYSNVRDYFQIKVAK